MTSLTSAQKLVHSYPDNVWALSALASQVDDVSIKTNYNAIVLKLGWYSLQCMYLFVVAVMLLLLYFVILLGVIVVF